VLLAILGVLGGDRAHQRIAGVAIGQQGADREENLGDGESRGPLVLEDVETDDALGVDVAVVDASSELDFGWFEGVLRGEVDVQEEDAPLVDGARRTQDGGDPLEQIVALGTSAAVRRRVQGDPAQLLLDPLCRGRQCLRHLRGARLALLLRLLWSVRTRTSLRHFDIS